MRTFFAFLRLERQRLFSLRNLVAMTLFLIISVYLVHTGIQQYRNIEKKKDTFLKLEEQKFSQIQNWDQYGMYGFRLYFMPSPVSVFFSNSSHFNELTCRIDSGEKLNIYRLFKGKKVFEEKPGKLMDFSGIFLILGSVMALFYGYDAFRHREYLKSLASIFGHMRTYIYIWLSRMLLLSFFLVFTISIIKLWILFNFPQMVWLKDIIGDNIYLNYFFLALILMMTFFFTAGTIAGSFKNTTLATFYIALFWLISVYLLPAGLNKIVENRAERITPYFEAELEKLKDLMAFEKESEGRIRKFVDRSGILLLDGIKRNLQSPGLTPKKILDDLKILDKEENRDMFSKDGWLVVKNLRSKLTRLNSSGQKPQVIIRDLKIYLLEEIDKLNPPVSMKVNEMKREFAKKYLNIILPRIEEVETNLNVQMQEFRDINHNWFSVFPSAFYLSTCDEVSSRGYRNTLEFFASAITTKRRFLHFYIDKQYLNPTRPINFIKWLENKYGIKNANLFQATPYIPGNYWNGLLFTLLWIVGLIYISYRLYRMMVFYRPRIELEMGKKIFKINRAKIWFLSRMFGRVDKNISELKDLKVELESGKVNAVLYSGKKDICNLIYNVLARKSKLIDHHFTLDMGTLKEKDFLYICHPECVPGDMKNSHFLDFIQRSTNRSNRTAKESNSKEHEEMKGQKAWFYHDEHKKALTIMSAMHYFTGKVCLIHNYLKGFSFELEDKLVEYIEELKNRGTAIIYITDNIFLAHKLADRLTFFKTDLERVLNLPKHMSPK